MPRQKKCRHRVDGEKYLLTFLFIGRFYDGKSPGSFLAAATGDVLAGARWVRKLCSYFGMGLSLPSTPVSRYSLSTPRMSNRITYTLPTMPSPSIGIWRQRISLCLTRLRTGQSSTKESSSHTG